MRPRPVATELARIRARRTPALLVALVWIAAAAGAAAARDDPTGTLGFEVAGPKGVLADWNGEPSGPAGTLFLDSTAVHGGRYSGRMERGLQSEGTFSSFAAVIPVDFAGETVELRGWLKREGVTGFAGLWQRQDGRAPSLQFDNMQSRQLAGTADWTEFRVALPLDRRATKVIVGGLLVGQGKVWIDDLALFVDGRPLAAAPERVLPKTPPDTDHEFDAGSKVTIGVLTEARIANLHTLGKVWGFLKYHHPRVTRGTLHWDYELFRALPRVLAARSREAGNRAIADWVRALGPAPACSACAKPATGRPMVARLDWLSDRARLGADLSGQLGRIYANRPQLAEQFYISFMPGVGNPDLGTELGYADLRSPDAGFRLLALYRLWNIVEYWFPYRDVMGEDWDGVLREFIPRFARAESRDAYRLEMFALIARMHDGHANLWNSLAVRPPRGDCSLPVTLRFLEGRLAVTGYSDTAAATASGLRIGDVVRAVDGVPVDTLVARWRPLYAASNEAAQLRDIASFIGRGGCADSGGPARLRVERDGRVSEVAVARLPLARLAPATTHDHRGETFRRVSDDLAYLELSSVQVADVPEYLRKSAGARCLLIDIRNYPAEFVVFALGGHLVSSATPFAKFTTADASNPGSFDWTPPVWLTPMAPRFEGRVAILVDEVSLSQAEYTTMAFRAAPGAVVVGSTTAGADGNVSTIPLPGGIRGLMSGIGVFYPDGTPTQRLGIVPDLVVRPTIAGIRDGRDEVLEAAVRHVLGREISDAERAALGPLR